MLKVYGLKKCTTCQKAFAWLDSNKCAYSFTDVKEEGLTQAQVSRWANGVGGWEKLINRAGFTWRGLDRAETADLDEAKAVALAVKYPSLIRRPLIEHEDGSVTIGFSDRVRERIAA
jgi:Spx/MgsR family transcriptional regulator